MGGACFCASESDVIVCVRVCVGGGLYLIKNGVLLEHFCELVLVNNTYGTNQGANRRADERPNTTASGRARSVRSRRQRRDRLEGRDRRESKLQEENGAPGEGRVRRRGTIRVEVDFIQEVDDFVHLQVALQPGEHLVELTDGDFSAGASRGVRGAFHANSFAIGEQEQRGVWW